MKDDSKQVTLKIFDIIEEMRMYAKKTESFEYSCSSIINDYLSLKDEFADAVSRTYTLTTRVDTEERWVVKRGQMFTHYVLGRMVEVIPDKNGAIVIEKFREPKTEEYKLEGPCSILLSGAGSWGRKGRHIHISFQPPDGISTIQPDPTRFVWTHWFDAIFRFGNPHDIFKGSIRDIRKLSESFQAKFSNAFVDLAMQVAPFDMSGDIPVFCECCPKIFFIKKEHYPELMFLCDECLKEEGRRIDRIKSGIEYIWECSPSSKGKIEDRMFDEFCRRQKIIQEVNKHGNGNHSTQPGSH